MCKLLFCHPTPFFKRSLREKEPNWPTCLAVLQKSCLPCQGSENGKEGYEPWGTHKTTLQSFAEHPQWCGSSEDMAPGGRQERESWRMLALHSLLSFDELCFLVSSLARYYWGQLLQFQGEHSLFLHKWLLDSCIIKHWAHNSVAGQKHEQLQFLSSANLLI